MYVLTERVQLYLQMSVFSVFKPEFLLFNYQIHIYTFRDKFFSVLDCLWIWEVEWEKRVTKNKPMTSKV